ncbi:MAG: glycoside hydrolase family 3 protein [Lachnospiraceae bacterium]|nr:glycoside hydrolase family 3 protein [Lachnospiraceae bacterium]
MSIDLKAKPFYLSDEQIAWVEETLQGMSLNDRIGQLFLPLALGTAEDFMELCDRIGLKPCGILFRKDSVANYRAKTMALQEHFPIPLLIAADVERGASDILEEGMNYGHNMGLAATKDPEVAYRAGRYCAQECTAAGVHWDFGPVSDLDLNPFNPVTNVRTFGSDLETVIAFARSMARGLRDGGLAVTAKHFPGDGVDGRDQHFLSSVNSMSMEEWDATYGKIYQALIDDGVESIMEGHIQLPSYAKYYAPGTPGEDILPASLNAEMNRHLVREKLGFNGVLITDASSMCGFTEVLPRRIAVPTCIENGADVFLFMRNLEEDFEFMKQGVADGILSEKRLEEAVTRILALKAKLRLPEKKAAGTLIPAEDSEAMRAFRSEEKIRFEKEVADRSITLVKDTQHLLPLDPAKQHRLMVVALGDKPSYHLPRGGYVKEFAEALQAQGFAVTVYDESPEMQFDLARSRISDLKAKYDVIVYFGNICTNGADSSARITWPGVRVTMPALIRELPYLMVSVDNPYLLMDAPRIPTYINAYTATPTIIETLAEKLAGKSPFKGVSPINAFTTLFPNTDK